jgi:hypothetical protein
MKTKLITAACLALILAGCGDKDDSATGSAEPGMIDKAMDTAGEMATDAADATGEAVEGASEMASDVVDATKETIHDAAQGVADATAPEADDATALSPEDAAALDAMEKELKEKAAETTGQ